MIIIGLTGGTGAGKSTVADYLKRAGYRVIDADESAREVVRKGSVLLQQLAETFGMDILDSEGELKRQKLGKIAFSSSENKEKLDSIMNEAVLRVISTKVREAEELGEDMVIVDAPTLFESGYYKEVDEIWTVIAGEETRINRIALRDGLSKADIAGRMNRQWSDEMKIKLSDEIIENNKTKEELFSKVEKLLRRKEYR